MATGAVLGVMVLQDASEAKEDDSLCPDSLCYPEGDEAIEDARTKATASTLTLALGGAAVVAGAVLYFTAPSAKRVGARLGPQGRFGARGMAVLGRF